MRSRCRSSLVGEYPAPEALVGPVQQLWLCLKLHWSLFHERDVPMSRRIHPEDLLGNPAAQGRQRSSPYQSYSPRMVWSGFQNREYMSSRRSNLSNNYSLKIVKVFTEQILILHLSEGKLQSRLPWMGNRTKVTPDHGTSRFNQIHHYHPSMIVCVVILYKHGPRMFPSQNERQYL